MRKILTIGGLAVASAILLSACSSEAAPSNQQASHNADDVTFAQQMVPHHSQALDMAKLVPTRSTDPQVLDLAARIEKAQDPEIQQMRGWLSTWGATSTSSMPGMDHGAMPDVDMGKLEQAKGAEFDKMWLDMMIKHHQGAIDMARTELAKGGDAGAKALAQRIIDAQQAEITEMQGLLSRG